MVICLERGADLHTAQLMPLPLTVSCFSKIQIGFTFLVLAHPGSPGQRAVKRVVCVCVCVLRCLVLKKALLLVLDKAAVSGRVLGADDDADVLSPPGGGSGELRRLVVRQERRPAPCRRI